MLFGKTFPEFGVEAGALTLRVVAINELIVLTTAIPRDEPPQRAHERARAVHDSFWYFD